MAFPTSSSHQRSDHALLPPSQRESSTESDPDMFNGLYTGLNIIPPIRQARLPEACMAPYVDANPCDACRKITIQALLSAQGHRLQTMISAILSAKSGCQLCKLIVGQVDSDAEILLQDVIVMRIANVNGTMYCQDEVVVTIEDEPSKGLLASLGLYTDEGEPAGEFIPGRRLAQRPDAAVSISLAKSWIDLSTEYMDEGYDQPKALPKRLIDVGLSESHIVHLRDFSGCDNKLKGHYISLSHRWDNSSRECITTSDNLQTRIDGISVSSLPPTFQDAILLTRSLGLQYLWIDSLCILQGSEVDWEEESAKMGSYYRLSWLTIGAGVQSAQGLFEERQYDSSRLTYWKIDIQQPRTSRVYFTDQPVNYARGLNEQSSILRRRAWTFQEELLSPRYLGFNGKQMYYRCGEYIYFESGLKEWLYPPIGERAESEAPLDCRRLFDGDWLSNIVTDYSSRELSYGSDKLPALSGIAHERYRFRGGEYLAGLWQEDLPEDLCWSMECASEQCTKSVEYRAPSWSWAAIDGQVAQIELDNSVIEADIFNVSTTPNSLDPMGSVSGGFLEIRGVLRRGLLRYKAQNEDSFPNDGPITKYDLLLLNSKGEPDGDAFYTFAPDTSNFSILETPLWFFNITSHVGLALLPVSSSHLQSSTNTFERIGLIRSHTKAIPPINFQDEKLRTTITII